MRYGEAMPDVTPPDRTAAPRPAVGRRERKKAATRQAIADAALELFLEHGFDRVSVRDVAEKADVSTTTLFAHFPSKESLVFDREEDVDARLRARFPYSPHSLITCQSSALNRIPLRLPRLQTGQLRQESTEKSLTANERLSKGKIPLSGYENITAIFSFFLAHGEVSDDSGAIQADQGNPQGSVVQLVPPGQEPPGRRALEIGNSVS